MGHMFKLYFNVHAEKPQYLLEEKLKRGISCLCIFKKFFRISRETIHGPSRLALI